MYYLVDTNVFLHVIDSNIYGVAEVCKRNGNDITITQTILKELDPGYYRENTDISSKEIYTAVSNLVTGAWGIKNIRLLKLEEIDGAEKELKKIRKRYYGWMQDADYLNRLVQKGIITRQDIKRPGFRNKDLGECELLAIAKVSGGNYIIITNDRGRVFLHPDQNLFDIYVDDPDIKMMTGQDWLKKLGLETAHQAWIPMKDVVSQELHG